MFAYYCLFNEFVSHYCDSLYHKISIYRGYIWCDNAHSTTITMTKLRSDLHLRTTPHTSLLRASYRVSPLQASYRMSSDVFHQWIPLEMVSSAKIVSISLRYHATEIISNANILIFRANQQFRIAMYPLLTPFNFNYIAHHLLTFNPQTARILTSHKGPSWAWEAQVLSHLYVCSNQFDITYHAWLNKSKTKMINASDDRSKLIVHPS